MIDWHQIDTLREEIGAEHLGEVIDLFCAEIREALQDLSTSDWTAPKFHFLKGSALNVGLAEFASESEAIEAALKLGRAPDAGLEKIVHLFEASEAALKDRLAL